MLGAGPEARDANALPGRRTQRRGDSLRVGQGGKDHVRPVPDTSIDCLNPGGGFGMGRVFQLQADDFGHPLGVRLDECPVQLFRISVGDHAQLRRGLRGIGISGMGMARVFRPGYELRFTGARPRFNWVRFVINTRFRTDSGLCGTRWRLRGGGQARTRRRRGPAPFRRLFGRAGSGFALPGIRLGLDLGGNDRRGIGRCDGDLIDQRGHSGRNHDEGHGSNQQPPAAKLPSQLPFARRR